MPAPAARPPGRDANAPERSGVSDRDAHPGHDGAAERDLDQRDAQRHAQVSLAHCGDGQELEGDHDVGDGKVFRFRNRRRARCLVLPEGQVKAAPLGRVRSA